MLKRYTLALAAISTLFFSFNSSAEMCGDSQLAKLLNTTITVRTQIETELAKLSEQDLGESRVMLLSQAIMHELFKDFIPEVGVDRLAEKMGEAGEAALIAFDERVADIIYRELTAYNFDPNDDRIVVADPEDLEALLGMINGAWEQRNAQNPIEKVSVENAKDQFLGVIENVLEDRTYMTVCEKDTYKKLLATEFAKEKAKVCGTIEAMDSLGYCRLDRVKFADVSKITGAEITKSSWFEVDIPYMGRADIHPRHYLNLEGAGSLILHGYNLVRSEFFKALEND